jgi:ATP-binding cassette subfamily B protein
MPFIGFLSTVSVAMILWTGSFEVIEKSMTIGGLIAFLSYMKLFFRPLRDLSEKFNLLQSALASAERVVTLLNKEKAKTRITKDKIDIHNISRLEFDKIDFSYKKGETILNNISFNLDQDRSIGIAGETGSGKSSIINLITGFYQPDKGRILVNNFNHNAMDIKDIRNKTALVMQDPFLVSGTIKNNIEPSRSDMNDKELEKALHEANCDFLFDKFSGLDTIIQEGGRPLSSGEKQLVCIARAFAFNPDLIIFDEATSYMDSQSEQKIHDAMNKLMKGRLAIIIAHRLSTIKSCDTILLLKNGTIKERGSHQELVQLKGEYYHLLQKEII